MKPHLEHLFAQTRRNGAVTAAEWWWCRPEALQEIGNILLQDNFVIVDHFLPPTEASSVRGEVTSAYEQGLLTHSGATGGGRFGRSESFTDRALRSDVLGYFDGVEPEWRRNGDGLKRALDKMVMSSALSLITTTNVLYCNNAQNTIVCELRDCTTSDGSSSRIVPELGRISTRSRAMVTCYPGRDSLYTKHYDNAIGNGRKLTAILYLNEEWKLGDGGELKLYKPTSGVDNADYVIIEPKLGRVLMFWSDKRCPHEVARTL